jgi:hypothetical protein
MIKVDDEQFLVEDADTSAGFFFFGMRSPSGLELHRRIVEEQTGRVFYLDRSRAGLFEQFSGALRKVKDRAFLQAMDQRLKIATRSLRTIQRSN